ncbi:hypothetical protein J8J40_34960, partial [Mycobacterium tuberculosis]|nr:hypothetical protein [Mycobacterium tuberculosis]
GDSDHDGRLTRRELFQYLRSNISAFSHSEQIPELQPTVDDSADAEVFPVPQRAVTVEPTLAGSIRVFVDGGGALPAA